MSFVFCCFIVTVFVVCVGGDLRVFFVGVVLRVCLVLVDMCYSWSVCLSCLDLLPLRYLSSCFDC